ncbi:hypothetical protein GPA27_01975 [Aromatoleum toluolicum]|uniref:HTH OST-type domain-containing protein n=1 Tax=Aromatoleum toluolicum TaxID=90060 RepID=A0ABX1NA52_9RHOO|nr:hypothetical protein [Aromatoleum toluolicum]NMF96163.1 hypothetical protein [Aromatoleum toluolicum]
MTFVVQLAPAEPVTEASPPPVVDAEHEAMRNEVMRKMGRNLLLFQQIERMLKLLIAKSSLAGYVHELHAKQKRQEERVEKQTMGNLVGAFLEDALTDKGRPREAPDDLAGLWFSIGFGLEVDNAYYEERKSALAAAVAERNELVHHFLPRWDLMSMESMRAADEYLDRQRANVLPEFEHLKSLVGALEDGWRQTGEFLLSGEWAKHFSLTDLRHSRPVLLLGDIAQKMGRDDGYVLLNTAGNLLRLHAPEETKALKERCGYKSLKALIVATELFDLVEEPTEKGGVRVFYRMKPGISLEFGETGEQ